MSPTFDVQNPATGQRVQHRLVVGGQLQLALLGQRERGGVGQVQIFGGGDYAMRAWLDPDKVASRGLTASDVVRAMREQNVQVSAGQLGAEPLPNSQFLTLINAQGRLKSEKEFGDIVLKSGTDGEIVRLADVAWVRARASSAAARSYSAW